MKRKPIGRRIIPAVALGSVGLLLALGPAAAYQLLHLETTSSLSLTLPVEEEKEVQVLFKDEAGQWQTADYRMDGRCVRIQIDVGRLAQGRTLLLINPPPTLNVNDTTPPKVTAVVVDGQARTPAGAEWDLGPLRAAPSRVVLRVEDGENVLRLDSATFELDGQRFSTGSPRVQARAQGDKAAQWGFSLPRLSHGAHTLRFRVADGAPEANVLEQTMTFTFVDFSNRALATFHATLRVDSNFPSYPSLAALQDGFVDLDGITCGNDVSWASAETEEPHWVEIGLPEPQRLHEMALYWARASKVYRTSQRWEVQVPDGDGWRTVYQSPDPPIAPTKFTRCRFDPVVTDRLRLWQPARSGSEERPNLLWLGEIEVR